MEDVLTSSVFGLLKYLPEEIALVLLSKFAGIPLPNGPLELELWPRYLTPPGFADRVPGTTKERELLTGGETEPDAVIKTKDWLVLLEAKYRSRLDEKYDQLGREFALGYLLAGRAKLRFKLLVVTRDTRQPMPGSTDLVTGIQDALNEASVGLGTGTAEMIATVPSSLSWISWQRIYRICEEICRDRKSSKSSRRLLEDVCQLVELRGLRPYDSLPIEQAMTKWENSEIPEQIWLSPIDYRYTTVASLTAGWEQLLYLDTSILQQPIWRLALSSSNYDLAELEDYQVNSLATSLWRPYSS